MSSGQGVAGKDRAGVRRWMLAAILLLAFGLRLYRLGDESLWYDETVSVYLAGKSVPDLVAHTAGDIHPPGYYLLLHSWVRLAGSNDFAVAFPSVFFGVLLVALAYWLAARVFGAKAALLAAVLVAISPFHVWYSQEVRMYTVGAVLGMASLGATLCLLEPSARSRLTAGWTWAAYILCSALGLWALYYFAFLLVAINLLVAVWWLLHRRRAGWGWLARWGLAQVAVLLLYLPWIPVAWRQATDPPVPPWRGFTDLGQVILETGSALSLGQSVEPGRLWPVLLLFAALVVLGLFYRRGKRDPFLPWLLAGAVFLPVLLIYLASFATPLYHVRYTFTYATPFYVLAGAGLAYLWQRWRPAALASLAVVVLFSGVSLYHYHTGVHYASDDHRAAVRYLGQHWRPGDAILVNAGYAYTALEVYWDAMQPMAWRGRLVDDYGPAVEQGPVVLQAGTVDGDPALGWGDPDSDFYAMSRAETEAALSRLFADFDRVWVYRIYDTVTDGEGFIRDWLQEHGLPFEDRTFTGESQLRVQGFLTGRDPFQDADGPLEESLADGSLRLVATTELPPAVAVGDGLDLALVWKVDGTPEEDAILFAGLFDAEGERWAQADERPVGSLYPISQWPAGATVRTPLRIPVPPGTPPGSYQLEAGWYRFVDGQPAWLPWTAGERLVLGEVDVVAPPDWSRLPLPEMAYSSGVGMEGVRLLGFEVGVLEAPPGGTVHLDLYWQALQDAPPAGLAVLQLVEDGGQVLAESQASPAGGRAPFAGLAAGQVVRDPRAFVLPGDLDAGVYNLWLGRRQPDGRWLPVRRGAVRLGSTYPLATVRAVGRAARFEAPAVEQPLDASLGLEPPGGVIHLTGYDLEQRTADLALTLYWQAGVPPAEGYKIFVHLVGDGGPADIRAQTDVYPHLPTTAWMPGEYVQDEVVLDLPVDLPPGMYTLRAGLYDEATGARLSFFATDGALLGDSLPLAEIKHEE